jgi:DNA-binding NarL/FixJ family response regulator
MSDIVLAVENDLLRRGIAAVLESADGIRITAEINSVGEVAPTLALHEPDLLLMETDFRRQDPDLLDYLGADFPGTAIMVLVDHTFDDCVIRGLVAGEEGVRLSDEAAERLDDCCMAALRNRAKGCVPKTSSPEELLASVNMVLAGQVSAGPWIQAIIDANTNGNGNSDLPKISGRELEVIELVAQGCSNKAIARSLGLKEQTVKNHLAHVMQKLDLASRVELALFALRHRLVPLDDH